MHEVMRDEHEKPYVSDIHVIMPIGGKATRALEVTHDLIPKHLIELSDGRKVLDNITVGLQNEGFRNFVFCTGHHRDQIHEHIQASPWRQYSDVEYSFTHETVPLGPDGAIVKAIKEMNLTGEALILPGDVVLPWDELAQLSQWRRTSGSDIALAVTSHITPRTTDIGKFIVNRNTGDLEKCYGREDTIIKIGDHQVALTSAAAMAIDIDKYLTICEQYIATHPGVDSLSMRDGIIPWMLESGVKFTISAYDIQGEILDLGTPSNIKYGQAMVFSDGA